MLDTFMHRSNKAVDPSAGTRKQQQPANSAAPKDSSSTLSTDPAIDPLSIPLLWQSLAKSASDSVGFNEVCDHLSHLLEDFLHTVNSDKHPLAKVVFTPKKSEMKQHSGMHNKASSVRFQEEDIASADFGAEGHSCRIHGVPLSALCRIIVDDMVHSPWNKNRVVHPNQSGRAMLTEEVLGLVPLRSSLSFAGFQAFLCREYMSGLERKLRYLVLLDAGGDDRKSLALLLHVYLSSRKDEILVIARDPLMGKVYKLQIKEDVSKLPVEDDLRKIVQDAFKDLKTPIPIHQPLYNAWETPAEDAAISELCKRLRLVKSSNEMKLVLGEDEKFVTQLRSLLDAAHLPFFYVCDDLRLGFECSSEAVKEAGSLRKLGEYL